MHTEHYRKMKIPLTDKDYLLKQFEGKGGWTYAEIPEIPPDKHTHFGWVRVCGTIDNYPINAYNLMPFSKGSNLLFCPINAKTRKKIGKTAGDTVRITLYADPIPTEITEELKICLTEENLLDTFLNLPKSRQYDYLQFIYNAKTDEDKINRIVQTIDNLR